MCRLFGLHAGAQAVLATFWLIDEPDSLAAQSHRNPDGTGIGTFDSAGRAVVDKQPMAAWEDASFAASARDLWSCTFVAHVRYASTGARTSKNTHPFTQDGRLFAHNGAFEGLDILDARLAELSAADLIQGHTDSERMFALITAETRCAGGDVRAGIVAAIDWLAENVPVYALNFILSTSTDLWAFRYPAVNELHLLVHTGAEVARRLDSRTDRIHARSDELTGRPWVVVASEPMDGDSNWRPVAPGTLIHVDQDLTVALHDIRQAAPKFLLTRDDLTAQAAQSEHPVVTRASAGRREGSART